MYRRNDKISEHIYQQTKDIQVTFNKFNISTDHKSALYALQQELTGVLIELNYNDTLLTIIGMCEGTIPLDKYFGVCKCCNSNFQRNPRVRQTAPNYHLCKECISTETKYCTIHQECYTDKVCFKCLKEDSHKQYSDSDPDAYVECPICGYRAIELPSHYDKIHGLTKEQYSDYPLVAEVKKNRYRGPANPWYKHGGKYSPFSKNNIIFDDVEAGIAATLAKTKQTWKDNPDCRSTNIEYWLAKGLTDQEARRALKERQSTFSIQKCIERHGEAEGTRIWKERQQKWQANLTSKPEDEQIRITKSKATFEKCRSKPEREIEFFSPGKIRNGNSICSQTTRRKALLI